MTSQLTACSSLFWRAEELICNSCEGTKESVQLQAYVVSRVAAKLADGGLCLE